MLIITDTIDRASVYSWFNWEGAERSCELWKTVEEDDDGITGGRMERMWVRGDEGRRIRLPGVSDVITLSRTMSHLWVNQATVTVNWVSAALCVTSHLHSKTQAIWVRYTLTSHFKPVFVLFSVYRISNDGTALIKVIAEIWKHRRHFNKVRQGIWAVRWSDWLFIFNRWTGQVTWWLETCNQLLITHSKSNHTA